MSPEQRKHAASKAARARWGKKDEESNVVALESKQRVAARQLAALFEEQLTALGLTDEEKDQRVSEFSKFVDVKVSAARTAKFSKQLHSVALQA